MKIYQKKNISLEEETELVLLERRHTLKEGTNEGDSEDGLRKTTRTISLGNFVDGQSSSDVEAVPTEKKSGFTRRPTVITENELSSSTLYKDRKAKINSDDESIEDLRLVKPPEIHDDLEPRALQNPNLKPIPVSSQRPRKIASCCQCFAISLGICIACLALIACVGAVVYMEFFARYKDQLDITNADTSAKNDKNPSNLLEVFQHPPKDSLLLDEPKIPDDILKDAIKASAIIASDTVKSKKVPVFIPKTKKDIGYIVKSGSNNSKVKALDEITSNSASRRHHVDINEKPKRPKDSIFRDNRGRIRLFKVPAADKPLEIEINTKNQDASDLKLNNRNIDDNLSEPSSSFIDKQMSANRRLADEKANDKTEVLDSSKELMGSGRNFNLGEMKEFEIKAEEVTEDPPLQNFPKENGIEHKVLPNNNSVNLKKNVINEKQEDISFDQMENSTDKKDENLVSDEEHSTVHNFKDNSIDSLHFTDHTFEDNSFNYTTHFFNNSLENDSSFRTHFINDNVEDKFLDNSTHSFDHDLENITLDHATTDFDQDKFLITAIHSIDHNHNDDSSDHFIDESFEGNSADHTAHFIDHGQKNDSLDHTLPIIHHNNKSFDEHNGNSSDSDDSSFEEHSLVEDHNQNPEDSAQLVFIRPVEESKAVPVQLGFLRRIGFDIKNVDNQQPLTANDMNMKFSLSEALKYLRSLDTDNKLPASREKKINQKAIKSKENKKTKLPLISESQEYLNILRKKMFENDMKM